MTDTAFEQPDTNVQATQPEPSSMAKPCQTLQVLIGVLVSLAATFAYVLTYVGRRFFAGYLNTLHLGHTPITLDAQILVETGGQILLVAVGVFAGTALIELLLFTLTLFVARQHKRWKFLYVILLGLTQMRYQDSPLASQIR